MHELLIFGQIPSSRHEQVLNVLAGIAAMQPQPTVKKHLVFKPNRKPPKADDIPIGASQELKKAKASQAQATQGDLFYMQLVAEMSNARSILETGEIEVKKNEGDAEGQEPQQQQWTLQFRDIPDAARHRPVTSRLINDTPITSGEPMAYMTASDYSHISSHLITGHRFTHNAISILLYRPLLHSPDNGGDSNGSSLYNGIDAVSLPKCRLLDPSGSYIVEAAVRVQDGSKVETMQKGVNELLAMKETLKGVVDMEVGDRLALDTRVKA